MEGREVWVQRQSWRKMSSKHCSSPGGLTVPGQGGVGITQRTGETEANVWQQHMGRAEVGRSRGCIFSQNAVMSRRVNQGQVRVEDEDRRGFKGR